MKFYADENVPKRIVARLRHDGHEVLYAIEGVRRLRDRTILRAALDEDALILTLDADYREMVLNEKRPTLGVIWIRLSWLSRTEQNERVALVIQEQGSALLHQFTTIYPDRVETQALTQPAP
ncbi:MAG TPA: DUF5615 family PIN-like protein [Ktedonobacterales bacterium]|jgi:predicted nuclease of predicted toxin-antitoxin system